MRSTALKVTSALAFICLIVLYVRNRITHGCGDSPPARLNPNATNVQIIGDSISKGMMRNALYPSNWFVFHPGTSTSGGCKNTEHGVGCLSHWIGGHTWDVIVFNFGLHDIGLDYEHVDLERYLQNLETIATELRRHAERLYWVTTTPVPSVPLSPPRTQCDVLRYNEAAAEIMRRANITVIDMFTFVMGMCDNKTYYSSCTGVQLRDNVHFTPAGYARMAHYAQQAI